MLLESGYQALRVRPKPIGQELASRRDIRVPFQHAQFFQCALPMTTANDNVALRAAAQPPAFLHSSMDRRRAWPSRRPLLPWQESDGPGGVFVVAPRCGAPPPDR